MKTLDDFNFEGKRVLLRSDLNSEIVKGRVLMGQRIKESSITINELKKKGAKVVVIAHQGNPKKDDFTSLTEHTILLNQFCKIKFVKDIVGEKAIKEIKNLKYGEAILLENIRFLEEELNPKKSPNKILDILVPMFDIYVNDAFSVCHRDHTSITEIPKFIQSCAGRLLEKEIRALEKINIEDCVYILGGAKPEENIKLLKGKKVLACGLFGQLCLVAKGKDLGYQNEFLKKAMLIKEDYSGFLSKLKAKLKNVETPLDFAVNCKGKRKEFSLEEFPLNYEIEDIGAKTTKKYVKIIEKAPAIYMKGPAGNTEENQYLKGTEEILKTVATCKGFTLIGGGHLSDAISKLNINPESFGHISLSGGALLNYIAGEELPGLKALQSPPKLRRARENLPGLEALK